MKNKNKNNEFFLTGIVISSKKYRDNDKSIVIFSKEKGKFSFVAKGVRKLTSKNRSSVELMTFGSFYLYIGKAYPILIQSKIIENYIYIRKNYKLLSIIISMISFLNEVLPKEQPNYSLFELFLWSIKRLENSKNPLLLLRYFFVKSIDYIGFTPNLDKCYNCGNKKGPFLFQFKEGFLFCNNCSLDGFLIENEIKEYYIALKNNNFLKIKEINIKNNYLQKFDYFLEKWIEFSIDAQFKGFDFLRKIIF